MTNGYSLLYNVSMNNAFGFIISACNGGFNWYGFLIGAAMVACIIIAYFMATKRGYFKDLVFDICIICIPLAIIGARVYYVIFDIIDGGVWTFKKFIGLETGGLSGLAIYGGLIGAVIGGIIVHFWKRNKDPQNKATFLQMADLAFTVIILGQAIGRWGNFANQEAFGNPVTNPSMQWFPYAVFIDPEHAALHGVASGYYQATFFYESFCNLIGFALMMWIYNGKRKSFDGFSLSVYLIWYGIVRVIIEGLRQDALWLVPGVVRVSQLLSAILIVVGIAIILTHLYMARAAGKKVFIMVDKDKLDSSYYGYDKSILSHPNDYSNEKKEKGFFAKMFSKTETEIDESLIDVSDGDGVTADAQENSEQDAQNDADESDVKTESDDTDGENANDTDEIHDN